MHHEIKVIEAPELPEKLRSSIVSVESQCSRCSVTYQSFVEPKREPLKENHKIVFNYNQKYETNDEMLLC